MAYKYNPYGEGPALWGDQCAWCGQKNIVCEHCGKTYKPTLLERISAWFTQRAYEKDYRQIERVRPPFEPFPKKK